MSSFKVSNEQRGQFRKQLAEQSFGNHLGPQVEIEPTEAELQDIAKACNKLWSLDINRLIPGEDYEINVGGGKHVFEKEDVANNPLFKFVKDDVFARPTFSRFYSLLDNYIATQNVEEIRTPEEENEEKAFIEEISRTAPIKYLFKYLTSKNMLHDETIEGFKKSLHKLWFDYYSRGGTEDSSSAFEHDFVGEIKGRSRQASVSGFHNWMKFFIEEQNNNVEYLGYILPKKRQSKFPNSQTQLFSIQFKWMNSMKPITSCFIGVSPEFELALYTLCYYGGRQNNNMYLGPYHVNVKVYRLGEDKIGSAYPEVLD